MANSSSSGGFRARDKITGEIVFSAIDCTREDFVDELARHFGRDSIWVVEHFALESFAFDPIKR